MKRIISLFRMVCLFTVLSTGLLCQICKAQESSEMAALPLASEKISAENNAAGAKVADAADMAAPLELDLEGLSPVTADQLKEGVYEISVDCSSSMFRITACRLTVEDGEMTAILTLSGTSYLYLFMGTGEEASAAGEEDYIGYEEDEDGAYTYTVPVQALDAPISCAAFSKKKEMWYDRTLVFRADTLPREAYAEGMITGTESLGLTDGVYTIAVTLEGGSGRASVESPAKLMIAGTEAKVSIVWGSPNYDYMKVDGVQYDQINTEGNSVFEIPVTGFDYRMPVTADTTAMGTPHEIEYTLYFDASTIQPAVEEQEADAGSVQETGTAEEQEADAGSVQETGTAEEQDTSAAEKQEDSSEQAESGNHGKAGRELLYAKQFSLEDREDGTVLITIGGTDRFLLVPEGLELPEEFPEKLPEGTVVLYQPLDKVYLAASSAMDFYRELGALDQIGMTSTKEADWSLEEVRDAMEEGKILYAGKYSAPDYELVLSEGTDIVVESTMIYHSPQVKETLEELGIPVMVERSSYEPEPLGRLEWIRLYGLLSGKQEEAEAFFDRQVESLKDRREISEGKTVAFFYINTKGNAVVRKPGDYVSRMIQMAGGEYILPIDEAEEENALSTMNMTMESFFEAARDADILIYDSAIEGEMETMEELLAKSSLLAEFKAVQEGNVWCTGKNMFQQVTGIGTMMLDMNQVISGQAGDGEGLSFLHLLQ